MEGMTTRRRLLLPLLCVALGGCLGSSGEPDPEAAYALTGMVAHVESTDAAWDLAAAEASLRRMGFETIRANETELQAAQGNVTVTVREEGPDRLVDVHFVVSTGWLRREALAKEADDASRRLDPQARDVLTRFSEGVGEAPPATWKWLPQEKIQ